MPTTITKDYGMKSLEFSLSQALNPQALILSLSLNIYQVPTVYMTQMRHY